MIIIRRPCCANIVTILMTLHNVTTNIVSASCSSSPSSRALLMTPLPGNNLQASKIYEVTATSSVQCLRSCLEEITCIAYSFDDAVTNYCTVYSDGSTSYDVTGLQVWVVTAKNIQVCLLLKHVQYQLQKCICKGRPINFEPNYMY